MFRLRVKKLLAYLTETAAVILLVLVCFGLLLSLLYSLFPSGMSLKSFVTGREPLAAGGSARVRQMLVDSGTGGSGQTEPWAAQLTRLNRQVKSKRAKSLVWKPAQLGMSLYDQDAVQTLTNARAVIHFDDDNQLHMGSNSLVIIKRLEQDPVFHQKRSYMVMVEGELSGQLAARSDKAVFLEVATPAAVTRLRSLDAGSDAVDFRINVNADQSSTISVYAGVAEIEAEGQRVRLEANQATRVQLDRPPTAPRALPGLLQGLQPRDGLVSQYRDLPPRIRFAWQPPADPVASAPAAPPGYRFQLARDAEFAELLVDESLGEAGFNHGNLAAGDYFWRVRVEGEGGVGPFSPARQLRLVQDRQPPQLALQPVPSVVTAARLTVRGTADPRSSLFAADQPVAVAADGAFEFLWDLRPGPNVLVIEAIDAAGNLSYLSHRVMAKF